MTHPAPPKCPNCGRDLTDDELFCYFCELELAKMKKKKAHDEHHPGKH